MPDGYESVGELGRTFDRFRDDYIRAHNDVVEDVRWLRRWLITSMGTVAITSIGSSLWAVFRS